MKNLSPMQKQLTLIRREFWEQRIVFVLIPVCCVALAAVTFAFSTARGYFKDISPINVFVGGGLQIEGEPARQALERFVQTPLIVKERLWEDFYMGPAVLESLLFWSVMVYYYLSTLYNQRKDRSILFWNSMPVSDTQTVMSKLLSGLVLAQGVYLFCLLGVQLVMLAIFLVYGMIMDVDLWSTYIEPAHVITRFIWILVAGVANIFWCLPVYAWFLFNSAWAKSAPVAWAAGPLIILIIPEMIIYNRSSILEAFFEHVIPMQLLDKNAYTADYASRMVQIFSQEMLISIILGVGLVVAAIRFNRSEDN